MIKKISIIICFVLIANINLFSQTNPFKRFTLKKEPTEIPSDSLGTTYFYSLSFEVNEPLVLMNAKFKLKNTATDSIINQQLFDLPFNDGIYLTSISPNGLIKDHYNFYILLGNVKSKEPLMLVADFTDSMNLQYKDILTNE
jgi:hypothetical protein